MSEASNTAGMHKAEEPFPPPAVGWYATVMLAFLYWMSLLDRFIISMMVDPIKADLGLSDVQFGLLQGVAFIISFTVFGFIFGALADRRDRRKLIFIGVTLWSLASAACGLAQNFWHLLIARMGLGAGEASLNPCATSMISDLFPRERLTSAMAVYSIGATIGSGTALMIGGAVIYWVTSLGDIVLPVLGHVATWQMVFFIVGLATLPLIFLVFTFPEPVRRGRTVLDDKRTLRSSYGDMLRFIKRHPRFFASHYIGFTIASGVVSGCVAWYPVHMSRTFDWGQGSIGLYLGSILMFAGIGGKLVTGWTVDAMYRRGFRDAQLRWYSASLFLAAPLGVIATISGNPWIFLVMIGLFTTLTTSMQACAMSSLNLVTPNQLRGTGMAVYTTVAALVGGSGGAVIIPLISQSFYQGDASIGLGIATFIGIACPISGLALFSGFRAMRGAMAEMEGGVPAGANR